MSLSEADTRAKLMTLPYVAAAGQKILSCVRRLNVESIS